MWGFAEAAESRVPGVAVGERLYGCLPTGRFLVVQPERIAAHVFVDGSAHRRTLPPLGKAWRAFVATVADPAAPWLVDRPVRGVDAACAALTDLIGDRVDARDGLMISL